MQIKTYSDRLESINKSGQKNAYSISEIESIISKIEMLNKEVVKVNENINEVLSNIDFNEKIIINYNVDIKNLIIYKDNLTKENKELKDEGNRISVQEQEVQKAKKGLLSKFSEEEKEL